MNAAYITSKRLGENKAALTSHECMVNCSFFNIDTNRKDSKGWNQKLVHFYELLPIFRLHFIWTHTTTVQQEMFLLT